MRLRFLSAHKITHIYFTLEKFKVMFKMNIHDIILPWHWRAENPRSSSWPQNPRPDPSSSLRQSPGICCATSVISRKIQVVFAPKKEKRYPPLTWCLHWWRVPRWSPAPAPSLAESGHHTSQSSSTSWSSSSSSSSSSPLYHNPIIAAALSSS